MAMCPNCGGKRACPTCGGSKWINGKPCNACNETGKCGACKGSGSV